MTRAVVKELLLLAATMLVAVVGLLLLWLCVFGLHGAAPPVSAPPPAQHSRRTPVVEAVLKTRRSIATLLDGEKVVGTAVVIDERGWLITNHHVATVAPLITANLEGATGLAAVFAEDQAHDVAVLRLPHPPGSRPLHALTIFPGTDLLVGETVIAVGNPFGYTNTVSPGVISALGRKVVMPSGAKLTNLIQTNAGINPGNSGGPLLNINGELIGLIVATRRPAQGISFALNAETLKDVLCKRAAAAVVSKVAHGLVVVEKVVSDDSHRQKVVVVVAGAGSNPLLAGDVLLKVGALEIRNRFDVERALWGHKPGDKVPVAVLRGGKQVAVKLTLRRVP
jgi:serine protease Do